MDDPVFKTKYHKYKTKVKLWEKSFKELNGRVPSKYDIREAPSAIRDSYKMYYKLKTTFLEETLSDVLDEDSFDLSILENSNSQVDSRLSGSFSEISTPDVSALTNESSIILQNGSIGSMHSSIDTTSNSLTTDHHSKSNQNEFEAEIVSTLNEKAWARTPKNESNSSIKSSNSVRKSISDKLFRGSSFQKRNPRKSLSRNSFSSNHSSQSLLSSSQKESFPDLQTYLSQKSKQQDETDEKTESQPIPPTLEIKPVSTNLINNINEEWLNRCNKANNLESDLTTVPVASTESRNKTTEHPKTFGLSNINVSALAHFERSQPVQEVGPKSMLSFDMGNLNLTAQNSFGGITAQNSHKTSMGHDEIADGGGGGDDDDEEIANSEDESDMNLSRQIRSIRNSIKRKHNEIDQEIPIKVATNPTKINNDPIVNDNPEEEKPKAIEKIKTQPIRRTKSITKPKPKTKSESEPNIVENEVAKAVVVTRKSTRNATKKTTYKPIVIDSDNEEEIDPFAGDDSDKDPNFSDSEETKLKSKMVHDSSPDTSEDETPQPQPQPKQETTKKANTRKRVARVSAAPKPRAKVERKARVPAKNKQAIADGNTSASETEPPQETPDDYLLEFGMENIKSVPRVPIAELKQNTMEFSKYVYSADSSGKSVEPTAGPSKPKPLSTKNATARDKLESKIKAGSLNENYVRLNLRKKVFVRGKKTMNFSRYKKKLWKSQKAAALSGPDMDMRGCDGGILTCFQCGLPGHFAQNCKAKSDRLLPLAVEEESPFPTLQEVEEMSNQKIKLAHGNRELPKVSNPTWKNDSEDTAAEVTDEMTQSEMETEAESENTADEAPTQTYIGHKIPEDFLIKAGLVGNDVENENKVEPLYKLNADGSTRATPPEVYEALAMFGHKEFRSGQEKAVMRILSGQSTLVTLSTGSGKSLCYQLPAYMYSRKKRCITLVISPLVSLMEDQVQGVPHFLNAQCLHTNLSEPKRKATIEAIKAGEVDVLLISPEAVVSSEKSTGFGSILRDLPPVAFVCIDECHCVSQFGHNFRPSYLMVCRVLYEKLKVKTVLGLTATATISTRLSIVEHLRIPDGLDGVISDIPLPDNLTLSISCDENRDIALIQLLKEPRFVEYKSIIIYCSRRDECERVAKNLRTYFQDNIARELELRNSSGKRKRTLKTTIEPYHAGMAASRRRTIQNAFMRGDLKIVVATIAFGMGINKADIRCVIHYNMPMNFESYVQEVGRAGRDGKPAHCHLFLDSKGEDKVELRRHIYANSIDRHIIRKLLHKIFLPCACKKPEQAALKSTSAEDAAKSDIDALQEINWNDEVQEGSSGNAPKRYCPSHEICFSVDETINELDIPEENISTLLCYLELHDQRYVKALSKAYIQCKVLSYGGPKALKNAALKCPPLAMAIALDIRKGISHDNSTFIEFPVIEIASAIGWNSGVVKYQLKQLEWSTENGTSRRSNISVEFSNLGFRVMAPGDLTPTELDSTLDMLYSRVKEQENNQINQLENVFRGLSSVAVKSSLACAAIEPNDERSEHLKKLVRKYFQSNERVDFAKTLAEPTPDPAMDDLIISDVYTMISRYPENNFTGRSLARIFHGVQSPVFPAVIWSRCKHWRAHLKTDFNHIVKLANTVILKLRT